MKLFDLLKNPTEFFENVKDEDWKPAFKFFLMITIILSIVTPIVNYLGIESTDFSSAYKAQILAYRFLKGTLLTQYGTSAYLIEAFLIFGFAIIILLFLTGFLHLVFRLMGGKGLVLNAWKASCYGVGPCVLGGFLPYVSLFAAFYSLILQLYIGPRVLYKVKDSRAIVFLAIILALTFIEMFTKGTTIGFFK
ncbi:MAG: YIP1 family protein [Candidatus Thermoplasmatota archaeon]